MCGWCARGNAPVRAWIRLRGGCGARGRRVREEDKGRVDVAARRARVLRRNGSDSRRQPSVAGHPLTGTVLGGPPIPTAGQGMSSPSQACTPLTRRGVGKGVDGACMGARFFVATAPGRRPPMEAGARWAGTSRAPTLSTLQACVTLPGSHTRSGAGRERAITRAGDAVSHCERKALRPASGNGARVFFCPALDFHRPPARAPPSTAPSSTLRSTHQRRHHLQFVS